jgi:thiamine biosynthesis lipoprotein
MVQGLPAAQALAARRPELPVLVAGQDGTVWQSPAMAARLKPIAA